MNSILRERLVGSCFGCFKQKVGSMYVRCMIDSVGGKQHVS